MRRTKASFSLSPHSDSADDATTKADGSPLPAVLRQDGHGFIRLAHAPGPALDEPLVPGLEILHLLVHASGRVVGLLGLVRLQPVDQPFRPLFDAQLREEDALFDGSVDLDVGRGFQGGVGEGAEVDVCGDVGLAGVEEGRDYAVGFDAAERVDGDGVCRAVVDYEGGAGGGARRADALGEVLDVAR